MGRDVDVEAAHSGTKIVSDITNQLNKKICVKNLSLETGQAELGAHFGVYGKIKHAYVIINHQTKRSKQFGYVEFYNEKDCENALKMGPHTVDGVVIDCEKFIPKAIERKNKKNVDSEIIQGKLRDLKVKEDEAKEKKLGSPERSPPARRAMEPAKWNEEDGPMIGRGQTRLGGVSPNNLMLPTNDPFGNIMQNSSANSQKKSPRSILVSKHTPSKRSVSPKDKSNIRTHNNKSQGKRAGFHSPERGGTGELQTGDDFSSSDGSDASGMKEDLSKIVKFNIDKSFDDFTSLESLEKLEAYRQIIAEETKQEENPYKFKSGIFFAKGQKDELYRPGSYQNLDSGNKSDSKKQKMELKVQRMSSGSEVDQVRSKSKGERLDGSAKKQNLAVDVPTPGNGAYCMPYAYFDEHGTPMPTPPQHNYHPSCYCPVCWNYSLKYRTGNQNKKNLQHQVNHAGVHDPDTCYACATKLYGGYAKSMTNSPQRNRRSSSVDGADQFT